MRIVLGRIQWHHLAMLLQPAEVDAFVAEVFPSTSPEFQCEAIGEGTATARWFYNESRLRPGNLISGPTLFAAADIALWYMSFTVLGLQPMAVTSEMQITFLRPASGGDVLARAELLRAGRTRLCGRVLVWIEGDEEKPVAHVTGSYSVLRPPSKP